jgi:hypothetical protein
LDGWPGGKRELVVVSLKVSKLVCEGGQTFCVSGTSPTTDSSLGLVCRVFKGTVSLP